MRATRKAQSLYPVARHGPRPASVVKQDWFSRYYAAGYLREAIDP
jgi:hypothetical protein